MIQKAAKHILKNIGLVIFCLSISLSVKAKTLEVGANQPFKTIKSAIALAKLGDTILVHKGLYREGNIRIDKRIVFMGKDFPILDGQKKYEVLSIYADSVVVKGFKVIKSGIATLQDPCGIKVYNKRAVTIENNILDDNFFAIYIQNSTNCLVKNNKITAYGKDEQFGNGIHAWKSDSLQVIGNTISGHRDGIYFEFVKNSIVWRNISTKNIRYGLHFMFSNENAYIANVFINNGAGIAVMYSSKVKMLANHFEENWGDAAHGLLLKEISDAYILGNKFIKNTSGIYMEGTNRVIVEKNVFQANGWAMRIQSNCADNEISKNNFEGNTFDVSTSGSLVLNTFNGNYWDKFEGYDLNKDGIGDIPFRPLSLFAVIAENNPSVMLLFRSFMITLLDKSEKILPSITPDNFIDHVPLMKPLSL